MGGRGGCSVRGEHQRQRRRPGASECRGATKKSTSAHHGAGGRRAGNRATARSRGGAGRCVSMEERGPAAQGGGGAQIGRAVGVAGALAVVVWRGGVMTEGRE